MRIALALTLAVAFVIWSMPLSARATSAAPKPAMVATGGKLMSTPTLKQISSSAGGARAHLLALPGLGVQAPWSDRLDGTKPGVTVALRAQRSGTATLSIRCGAETFARGNVNFLVPRATGFRLALSQTAAPGTCALLVAFHPKGRARTSTTTTRLVLLAAKLPAPVAPSPRPAPTPTPTPSPTPNPTGVDTLPPAISGPPSVITKEAGARGRAIVTWATPTAVDNVDGSVPVSCSPASGSTFALGDTTVACTARDARGSQAAAEFTVRVRDTTPPVIAVPGDVTAAPTSPSGATVSYRVTATDVVDGPVAASCAPPSGSTFAEGNTTAKCTAIDAHGNKAMAAFSVTVPPYIVLYEDQDLGGRQLVLTGSVTDLRQYGFNDITTAVQIFGPIRATFYQDANFGGARSTGSSDSSGYPFTCDNVGKPYQARWETIYWCYWEFGSPQEIGNDQISSVWITPNTSFDHSSRLVSPSGLWSDATVDASTGYRFNPDGTYYHLLHVNGRFYEIDGHFRFGYYAVNILQFPPHWTGNFMDLTGNVLTEFAGFFGGPIISQTPQPDVKYRFQYIDYNHIQILEGSMWQPYAFNPDPR